MTPEELKEIRSTLEFASQAGAKDEFMDTNFNLLEFIDEQASQIEALKEKLITETAYHLYYKCQGDCCRMICSAGSHKEEARQQLAKEMKDMGVEW